MGIKKAVVIVGCGPAGLQLGYFLNKINIEYIILEQNDIPASFFKKYPHSGEMISINKKYTGSNNKEFNLRHDWNSLLNENEIEMRDFSDKYYPKRDELQMYLEKFAQYHKIKIEYNCRVNSIRKNKDNNFVIKCVKREKSVEYVCNKVVIASGLNKKNIPKNIINIEKYSKHYSDYDRDYFKNDDILKRYINKNILIIGYGNSAFELANILNEYCSTIMIINRGATSPKPAMCTHYVGNLRSKYISFYDTFFLKSLNAMDEYGDAILYIKKESENVYGMYEILDEKIVPRYNDILFNEIINCTGWNFDNSIFDENLKLDMFIDEKYPKLNGLYESDNIKNLYFIGSTMHSIDYKKSSGSFIHGFRYLIDNFVKMNFTKFSYKMINNINDLVLYIIKRINISSGLYQMYGQLCDIFYKTKKGYMYYEGIPLSYVLSNKNEKIKLSGNVFIVTLEYGDIVSDMRVITRKFSRRGYESDSVYLHPILRVINMDKINQKELDNIFYPSYEEFEKMGVDSYHFDENILVRFIDKNGYIDKFNRIIKSYE